MKFRDMFWSNQANHREEHTMGKAKETDAITTFLGGDTVIEGTIKFDGTIRLDGRVSGRIDSQAGTVIIGEKAVIDADVSVGVAIVMGQVNGVISAENRIEVYPPARIEGDIQAPVISIDAGVQFNGSCTMTPRNSTAEPAGHSAAPAGEDDKEKPKVKNFPKNL